MDTIATLKEFITNELISERSPRAIEEDDNLMGLGLIDSMGVLQLSAFIEEEFGIEISPEEFTPDNFRSIATIAELIKKKC
jgi:acyl carrier protein